jgi:uncharacterized protein (DUF983 family)
MRLRSALRPLTALWSGLRLRCPACRLGRLFERRLRLRETCPYCGVRFERASGESLGGAYINTALTIVVALGGFFVSQRLWDPPAEAQLVFWAGFALLFPLLSYRVARGLWISVAYLTGGVYADPDYEREYIRPAESPNRQGLRPHG